MLRPFAYSRRLTGFVPLVAFCAFSIILTAITVQAGTIEIPAWAFDRGNVVIDADPAKYADAGPVVVSGEEKPWGWRVEYDIEYPVAGMYRLHIQFATAKARPVEVLFDTRNVSKSCTRIGYDPKTGAPSSKSSGAVWEPVLNNFGGIDNLSMNRKGKAKAGKHTIMLTSQKPLPHLLTLRLTTPEPFPKDWQPPKYKVRDLSNVPKKYHKQFESPGDVDVAALRRPVPDPSNPRAKGSLKILAWTFDRGNVEIYADPSGYANAGPLVGGPEPASDGVVEYDIDFPVAGDYTLHIRYASPEARPVDVLLDNRKLGIACGSITFGSAPLEIPVRLSGDSWAARKAPMGIFSNADGVPVKLSVTAGKHTLKLTRPGPLPNLMELRLDSMTAFPKDWKQAKRKMPHLDRVPPEHRAAFLPADAVNVEALRVAIKDTIKTYGRRYDGGEGYLKRLSELEKNQGGDLALKSLRREAMLAHPELNFDKLLFLKRPSASYGHTYTDHHGKGTNGSLCVLSPVAADGKVTELVPELKGGLYDRFDLSYDAKKVVFAYKKPGKPFRIYEVGIDPQLGKMIPGSLRQLTFGIENEEEVVRCNDVGKRCHSNGFDDMDPIYLPDGKIIFVSTRTMRNVFCAGATVTTLHIMDADGKNLRCLSTGPINETAPSVMDDGRIIYTRWEYVDKGLGNGQGLWSMRPDGSAPDHVFKNNTVRPAGMSTARSIPGSRSIVAIGGTHHVTAIGAVILVDTRRGRRGTQPMTCITPEVGYACMAHSIKEFGYFMDPYPFSEDLFLVSHARGGNYGIYALDRWGNRAELHSDPKISCFEPFPIRPRRKPMKIAAVTPPRDMKEQKTGTMFVQDVYQGMTGIERGRVKYLRVMGPQVSPWRERGMNTVGWNENVHRKKVYGLVNVHDDGSACFEVPAEENLFFQALDKDYKLLQHMPTFVNLMPGESRSCVGCHEPRRRAPHVASARPTATRHPVQKIVPQPGDSGPRMIHYAADVQPVLDKHCVSCHSGGEPKGGLDLVGTPTRSYSRSYESIMGRNLITFMDCHYGRSGFHPLPPLTFGSNRSKLIAQIAGEPCKGKLTTEELLKITTWIDANSPYYGTYRGKRELKYQDEPDFRLPPLVIK